MKITLIFPLLSGFLSLALSSASVAAESSSATGASPVVPRLEMQAPAIEEKPSEGKAVKFSFDNKSDMVSGPRGGSSARPTTLGAVTLGVDLNFEKMLPALKGLTGTVQGLGLYGNSPSTRIGDYH